MKKVLSNHLEIFKKQDLIIFLAICSLLFVIGPYLIVATYAGPGTDDYINLVRTLRQSASGFWGKCIQRGAEFYLTNQGTYFGSGFCVSFGGAVFHYGGVLALHIEYLLIILLFSFSVFVFFVKLYEYFIECSKTKMAYSFFSTAIICLMVLYDYNVCEVFYWHAGISLYTIPMSLALLSIAIALSKSFSSRHIFVSSLMAFLAVGGALNVTAFTSGVLLLIVFFKSIKKQSLDITIWPFMSSLTGAIINVVAPGNFVRHNAGASGYAILTSIKYGFWDSATGMWEYFSNGTAILIIFVCAFLANHLHDSKVEFVNPILLGSLLFIGTVIIDFPVHLGYGTNYFPLRVVFIHKVSAAIFMFALSIDIVGWVMRKIKKKIEWSAGVVFLLAILFCINVGSILPQDCWTTIKPFKVWHDVYYNDSLETFEATNNEVIETLKEKQNEDVVIHVPSYNTLGYLYGMGLAEDPNDLTNICVAEYYGNKSIVFKVGK